MTGEEMGAGCSNGLRVVPESQVKSSKVKQNQQNRMTKVVQKWSNTYYFSTDSTSTQKSDIEHPFHH